MRDLPSQFHPFFAAQQRLATGFGAKFHLRTDLREIEAAESHQRLPQGMLLYRACAVWYHKSTRGLCFFSRDCLICVSRNRWYFHKLVYFNSHAITEQVALVYVQDLSYTKIWRKQKKVFKPSTLYLNINWLFAAHCYNCMVLFFLSYSSLIHDLSVESIDMNSGWISPTKGYLLNLDKRLSHLSRTPLSTSAEEFL